MKRAIIISLLILSGCSGNGGGSSTTQGQSCGSKPVQSTWTGESTGLVLDLTGLTLNTPTTMIVSLTSGESCSVDAVMNGTQCSGTYQLSNSTWNGDGGGDPGCSSLDMTGTYEKSPGGLYFDGVRYQ